MKRARLVAAAVALFAPLGVLAPLGAATPAQAAEQVPFTIDEQITLAEGVPVLETFTATGPLCPSGTFTDTVQAAPSDASQGPDHSGKLQLIVRSVYTCDDGSGTFNALKELVGTLGPDTVTSTGPIQLLGGTGAFTDLVGHGVDTGSISGDTATATDSGFIVRG
jgi:hypothetical protein